VQAAVDRKAHRNRKMCVKHTLNSTKKYILPCFQLVVDVISDVDDDVGLVPHGHVKLVKGLTLVVPG